MPTNEEIEILIKYARKCCANKLANDLADVVEELQKKLQENNNNDQTTNDIPTKVLQ